MKLNNTIKYYKKKGNDNMALGNEGKKTYDQNYFSRLSVTDQSTKNRLGYRFSSGMLVLTISRPKNSDTFEFETLEEIFITPTKAKILTQLLEDTYPDGKNVDDVPGVGVTSGLKETVSAVVINPNSVTVGKVDGNGKWVGAHEVAFNHSYHFGIQWNDVKSNDFTKMNYDNIEYNMLKDLIKSFSENMAGAIAYSVADLTRFDTSRQAGRLKPIYDKLGIEWGGGSRNNGGSGNNFFNNNTRGEVGGTAEHKDMDDAIDELPFD